MKTISILCLVLGVLCNSCSHRNRKAAGVQSVFPHCTVFPAQQPIPRRLIDTLPERIAALPVGRSISISRLVDCLGLSHYRNNVSANFRWGTFFMYLDSDHILYFTMDPDTLADNKFLQTPWNAKVLECAMRRNPDVTVISKRLVKR